MNLTDFIHQYDQPGTVLLFFGKRDVPLIEAVKIRKLGMLLSENSKYITFRTGHAKGADEAFGGGVAEIDINRIQLVLPNQGHRKKDRIGYTSRSIDEFSFVNEDAAIAWSKKHSTHKLVDRYVEGFRDRTTPKVAPIIRDSVMVVGHEDISPTNVALYWDDPNNPNEGGTGFTLQLVNENNIVSFGQDEWEGWLDTPQ